MSVRNFLFAAILCMPVGSFAQQIWVNQLDPTRAINWTLAGIPGGVPTNRTVACASLTSSATAANINSAFANCPNGQYVALAAGTYSTAGWRLQANVDSNHGTNVTIRGAGTLLTIINFTGSPDACMGAAGDVCFINNFAIGGDNAFALPPCGGGNSANCADWTGGYAKDATSITLKNVGTNWPGVSGIIILDQANDLTNSAGLIQCDVIGPCSYSGGAFGRVLTGSKARDGGTYVNANYSQVQVVKIISDVNVAGTHTVGISPGLYANNWRSGQTPGAYWSATPSAGPLVGAGLENLTLDHCVPSGGVCTNTSQVSGIEFVNCYQCYMKNVRSLDSQRNHVQFIQSSGVVVRDSYFYLMKSPGTTSYGMEPQGSSDLLIENNIFEKIASPILLSEGSGVVISYNFSWNDLYSNPNFMQTSTVHDAGNMMNLFEGNMFNGISNDVAHGTSPLTTVFRNWVPGQEPAPFNRTSGTIAIEAEPNARAENVIGNVLGSRKAVGGTNNLLPCNTDADTGGGSCSNASIYHTVYEASPSAGNSGCQTAIYQLGWANPNNCTGTSGTSYTGGNDSTVASSMMRWANCDVVTGTCRFDNTESSPGAINFVNANSTPASHALPASYIYPAKPAWWSGLFGTPPWPPVGPDVTGGQGPNGWAYQNLAYLCYANTTSTVVAYPSSTGGVLNFDGTQCYSSSAPAPPPLLINGQITWKGGVVAK